MRMSKGIWIITKDLINLKFNGVEEEVGTASRNYDESKADQCKYKFRMSDDDDEIYFYGLADSDNDLKAFSPLDDFGTGGYGCTNIEYWNEKKKQWEYL